MLGQHTGKGRSRFAIRLVFSERADADLAERYLTAFVKTLGILSTQPEIGALRRFQSETLKGVRSFQISGAFRVHLVFYRIEGDSLVVLRVLHGMRDIPRRLLDPPGT